MNIQEALNCIGAARIIWIDDHFSRTPETLGHLLSRNIEITASCAFPELSEAIEQFGYNEERATADIIQALADCTLERREEILQAYLQKEDEAEPGRVRELSVAKVDRVCRLLGVKQNDRWPFEGFHERLKENCDAGDADVGYIIDLKDSKGTPDDRTGLLVLEHLQALSSKGTAFILTHEADVDDEARIEQELLVELQEKKVEELPVCVISKNRLSPDDDADSSIEEALRVAVKRAGLRRNVHQVLTAARTAVTKAYDDVMRAMVWLPPEQLEQYAVERAYAEGVSETHVIERALTAHISKGIRSLFAVDEEAIAVAKRLRALRAIPLADTGQKPDARLAGFFDAEVWEEGAFVNNSFAQLACGDVFESGGGNGKFVLLAAPCDLALRNDGTRVLDSGVFAPLQKLTDHTKGDSYYVLPFLIAGTAYCCDLKTASPVNLAILDLSTFRPDGGVKFEKQQERSSGLLDGSVEIYDRRTKIWTTLVGLEERDQAATAMARRDDLQLIFSAANVFNQIRHGRVKGVAVNWSLSRIGRIRMPYASAILNRYVSRMSRQAFEINYLDAPETAQ